LDEDVSIRDEEKCCVCGDFEPKALRDKPYIEFVKWAQCVVCCHWVHLSYCVPEKVVRKDTKVVCPHCKQQWKLRNILLYFLISCWLFNIDNYLNRILYSNHQLHTSLKSHKKNGKYALHTYLELKLSPLSKLGYTIFFQVEKNNTLHKIDTSQTVYRMFLLFCTVKQLY
jgi:hypothetical protein